LSARVALLAIGVTDEAVGGDRDPGGAHQPGELGFRRRGHRLHDHDLLRRGGWCTLPAHEDELTGRARGRFDGALFVPIVERESQAMTARRDQHGDGRFFGERRAVERDCGAGRRARDDEASVTCLDLRDGERGGGREFAALTRLGEVALVGEHGILRTSQLLERARDVVRDRRSVRGRVRLLELVERGREVARLKRAHSLLESFARVLGVRRRAEGQDEDE
jgi:hypothetical protein